MENGEKGKVFQEVAIDFTDSGQDLRYIRLESTIRKIRANGWAKKADDQTVAEEALKAVQAVFPEMSPCEAAAAVKRLRQS